MPIYEYRCAVKGAHIEVLRKYEDRGFCPCGCEAPRVISAPAKTPYGWGDSKWDGARDNGLGTTLVSKKHREAVMRAKGLRELQPGEAEDHMKAVQADHSQHEANMASFRKHKAETGDAGLALARTFPSEGALQ